MRPDTRLTPWMSIARGAITRLACGLLAAGALAGCGGGAPDPALDTTALLDPASDSMAVVAAGSADSASSVGAARVAAIDSTDADALLAQSRLLFQGARHAEAIALLAPHRTAWTDAMAGGSPAWSRGEARELLTRLALHEAAAGSLHEGVSARAALAADSATNPLSASRLAYLELMGEEYARAAAPAARAVRADSTRAVRLNNFGITRLQAGDVVAAERLFRAAIEREPELPGPYYNLAILAAFYRMDPEAGRRWFAAYRRRGVGDPDHLAEALAAPDARADRDAGDAP